MNRLSYYDRMHLPWTDAELELIRKQYTEEMMDVIQIGNIHHKTPGQVGYRLRQIGVVGKNRKDTIRGYEEYMQSDLFKESQSNSYAFKKELMEREKETKDDETREARQEKRKIRQKEILQTITDHNATFEELTVEVNALRAEVKSMKKDIKEILRLMTAVYDFENQE